MTYYGEMISALDVKSCRTKTNKVINNKRYSPKSTNIIDTNQSINSKI